MFHVEHPVELNKYVAEELFVFRPIKSSRYSRAADTDPQPLEAIKVSASCWIRRSVIEAGFLVLRMNCSLSLERFDLQ